MEKATAAQLRMLHALARQHGMDEDLLHARCSAVTGRKHLSELSKWQCGLLIDDINGKRRAPSEERITPGQVTTIFGLAKRLGWLTDDDGHPSQRRLLAFLEKRYGVSCIDWLTPRTASKAIEAMKAILAGGRGERKERSGNGGKRESDGS